MSSDATLPDRWQDILDFERVRPARAGSKIKAVRDRFGVSPARYYQMLDRLLDDPAALRYDPLLVHRLRRLRETRRRRRVAPRIGRTA